MAFYTPSSIPHSCTMNALPTELLSSWSLHWRPKDVPLTPPMTSTFERRKVPQLPSIAHFDRQLSVRHLASAMPPLTPPDDVPPPTYSPAPAAKPPAFDMSIDWLDVSRTRSARFIAEKTCEMICYLWFASSPPTSPFLNRPAAASNLQLVATPTFVQFMQKLLETTQVSHSVIVLSLHYIYRLKDRNNGTPAQAGSEFRIAVAALMMANKFLDDCSNTYTNKTWSEVSGIELPEINRMEREFLLGVDFNLYVDKKTYESWLSLLKGLVLAKERDCRHFRKSRTPARAARLTVPSARSYSTRYAPRARSTSPNQISRPSAVRSGAKRTAEAAFSPTSASFSQVPAKRPAAISLQIPEPVGSTGSHSPLEGLQSFAKMSLHSPSRAPPPSSPWVPIKRDIVPQTLVTAYHASEGTRNAVPENLYFYTLTGSPMDEEDRFRRPRLRYHQPPPPSASAACYSQRASMPVNIQSASTSPNDVHMHLDGSTAWTQPVALPPLHHPQPSRHYTNDNTPSPIPAPFANAGPPGIQFYSTAPRSPPRYTPHHDNWYRARGY
ncbi:cyclin-domain-containing protein [Armillaria novae-zelandiae]|uniref:Cyclin-domain-containing protein n=1 Tax=Armillaria novae-zelandiae TaxID=153914 RepID=A0AA39P083_9AGAR|nr:cyclin-domain-containing protein [Armillaria novae-zelandiae]